MINTDEEVIVGEICDYAEKYEIREYVSPKRKKLIRSKLRQLSIMLTFISHSCYYAASTNIG